MGERGGDDLFVDADAGVLGVGLGVAGVAGPVRAQVVDVGLGASPVGAGEAVHAALALVAADAGAQRVQPAGGAGRGLVLGVADVAPFGADGLGLLPQVHADQFGVAVGLIGPGPVGAGDVADFPLAWALAGAGVAGPAEHDAAGVLGVLQDVGNSAGAQPFPSGDGASARSSRRAMVRRDTFSYTRHS